MIEIFILSLIQGITEFLPISSSSHLIIFSKYVSAENKNLTIDVSLHIGSFLAAITYFHKDIINFIKNKYLFLKIITASIPIMLFGFFLVKSNFIEKIRNIEVIGWTTLIFGILLYISDKYKLEKKINTDFDYKSAIVIGMFQILALIPGVSRSGISITAARLLNFERFDAAKIAFLLSIPTLGAVSIFGLADLVKREDTSFSTINIIAILCSFFFSFITIKFFLKYIKNFSLNIFVIYRVVLGATLLLITYL
jgi:undecaprenyl-diphosphatase